MQAALYFETSNGPAEVVSGHPVDIQIPSRMLLPGNDAVLAQSDRRSSVIGDFYRGSGDNIFPHEVKPFPSLRRHLEWHLAHEARLAAVALDAELGVYWRSLLGLSTSMVPLRRGTLFS